MIPALHALCQCAALSMALYCLVMRHLRQAWPEVPPSWDLLTLYWLVVYLFLR